MSGQASPLMPRAVVDLYARGSYRMRLEMRIGTNGAEIAQAAVAAATLPGVTVTLEEKPRYGEFNLDMFAQDKKLVTAAGRRARDKARAMIKDVGYASIGRVVGR